MGVTTEHLDRLSTIGSLARHPVCALPPTGVAFYATAATVGTNLNTAGIAWPNRTTTVTSCALACNANIQVLVGGTYTNAKSISVLFTGKNENWDPVSEIVVCTGNGSATQNFPTQTLWSTIDSITLAATTGNLVGTETFTIGIGDGNAGAAAGTFVMQNPLPGLPLGALSFVVHNNVVTSFLMPVAIKLGGRGLDMGTGTGGTAYGATAAMRLASFRLLNVNSQNLEPIQPVTG